MIYEDLFKAVMSVIHGTETPHISETRYHVTNAKILQLATTLQSIQEQQDTPLVETYNQ